MSRKLLGIAAVMGLVAMSHVGAEVEFKASTTAASNYLWRGYFLAPGSLFSGGSLSASLNDTVSLTGLAWNYTNVDGPIRSGEYDYGLSATISPEGWPGSLTAGWLYYDIVGLVQADDG